MRFSREQSKDSPKAHFFGKHYKLWMCFPAEARPRHTFLLVFASLDNKANRVNNVTAIGVTRAWCTAIWNAVGTNTWPNGKTVCSLKTPWNDVSLMSCFAMHVCWNPDTKCGRIDGRSGQNVKSLTRQRVTNTYRLCAKFSEIGTHTEPAVWVVNEQTGRPGWWRRSRPFLLAHVLI